MQSVFLQIPWSSSSSWGCELKCWAPWLPASNRSHPLREDVSWNILAHEYIYILFGHPLREDVSWNDDTEEREENVGSSSSWGCELKCKVMYLVAISTWSSSSWGCELKCTAIKASIFENRHPLREDVSWNITLHRCSSGLSVILFVRMWVEMSSLLPSRQALKSSSSWGCELKCITLDRCCVGCSRHPLREDVSWNNWLLCSI